MNWLDIIKNALDFIEKEISNNKLSIKLIAEHVHVSESHLTRSFNVITGYTLSIYIRNRRLSVAGEQLKIGDISVTDAALNLGYDSPEAFSKAFKRFHGTNPSECKNAKLKQFHPLRIRLTVTQDTPLNFKILQKEQIILDGETNIVSNEDSKASTYLWSFCEDNGYLDECYDSIHFKSIVGVCTDDKYTIKAMCSHTSENTSLILPAHKWVVFSCEGTMPNAIDETWNLIYSDWIQDYSYEIDDLPQLEVYYDNETYDDYTCEIWIPIK